MVNPAYKNIPHLSSRESLWAEEKGESSQGLSKENETLQRLRERTKGFIRPTLDWPNSHRTDQLWRSPRLCLACSRSLTVRSVSSSNGRRQGSTMELNLPLLIQSMRCHLLTNYLASSRHLNICTRRRRNTDTSKKEGKLARSKGRSEKQG